jgi:PfaB family protein
MKKIAIIGMGAAFTDCNSLDKFERSIFCGTPAISISSKNTGDIQALDLHQQFLDVAHAALKDADMKPGKTIAIILSAKGQASVPPLLSKSSTLQVDDIAKSLASRLSVQWDLICPSFTLIASENSTFKALDLAQTLLCNQEADAVLIGAVDLVTEIENNSLVDGGASGNAGISTLSYDRNANGTTVGEGAGAVVLKCLDAARQNSDRIYAVVDAIAHIQQPPSSNTKLRAADAITQVCSQAFAQTEIEPEHIGYLEVFGSGIDTEDTAEIQGLIQAYRTPYEHLSCAMGSIKANIGHTRTASGMASLIKTALCLYHQYLPATPQWSGPKQPELWQNSPFYVLPQSRLWLEPEKAAQRTAAINSLGSDYSYAHILLSGEPAAKPLRSNYLEQTPFYLFPLAALNQPDLLAQLEALQTTVESAESLAKAASYSFAVFQKSAQAPYALAIVGHDKTELSREIERALTGIPRAFEKGSDWKTPLGSYFTANPQGQCGGVAFVYPGAFTSYMGLIDTMPRLFPRVMDGLSVFNASDRMRQLMDTATREVYPRSMENLSARQMERLEMQLQDDATTMLLFGTGAAVFFTSVLREYFRLEPQAVFGYSLGEFSMMYALKVWTSADTVAQRLHQSPLFKTQLSGPKATVRKYWGLPPSSGLDVEEIWGTYVLLSEPAPVQALLGQEPLVYLTHINTPTEVVIAGDNLACQRIIQTLKCDYFPAPSKHVLHCDAMRSELDELTDWFTLPVQAVPKVNFYTAATYDRTSLSSTGIAQSIAKALCQPVDFPHLIHKVYGDGARVFVELGPGGTCSRWIRETLKQQDNAVITFNSRGVDDHTSTIRALAKLTSHRVSLDLSCLYEPLSERSAPSPTLIPAFAVSDRVQERKTAIAATTPLQKQSPRPSTLPRTPLAQPSATPSKTLAFASAAFQPKCPQTTSSSVRQPSLATTAVMTATLFPSESNPPQILKNSHLPVQIQPHASFLEMRQDSLRHMGQLIRLQMLTAQKIMGDSDPSIPKLSRRDFKLKELEMRRSPSIPAPPPPPPPSIAPPFLNESAVLAFAEGSIADSFGSAYAVIDTYPRRSRLPMSPYLFVSRVTRLDAERGQFQPCSIETEYDIPDDAWYAVNDQVPAAIFVEAYQSVILLLSYLGVDFETKGQRVFRALDNDITFLGELPQAGETFRCAVKIHSFTRSGETLLCFFDCEYFVGDRKFLEIKAGAGFFTDKELIASSGITLTKLELAARSPHQKQRFTPLIPCPKVAFHEQDLIHLSTGNLSACFGVPHAAHQNRNPSLRLPLSAFRMLDRVLAVNPQGGAWGLGMLVAEKDLHPEQWYFNCHFKDDYCMPGTVVADGAIQLLQFYLLYLGLHIRTHEAKFHPIPKLAQTSRSRGQVTPNHGKLIYQLDIFEVGLEPTPFLKAEALIKFQGKTISSIKNLGVQLWEKSA